MFRKRKDGKKDSLAVVNKGKATAPVKTTVSAKGTATPPVAITALGVDLDAVRALAVIAGEFGLTEIETNPSGHVRIVRPAVSGAGDAGMSVGRTQAAPTIALAPPAPIEGASEPGTIVSSPFVGTFYRAPSPDTAAFVEVGQRVKKGQVVCIVEAMKLMNEIEAEAEGVVAEVLAKNGEHVEYGQGLIRLTPF